MFMLSVVLPGEVLPKISVGWVDCTERLLDTCTVRLGRGWNHADQVWVRSLFINGEWAQRLTLFFGRPGFTMFGKSGLIKRFMACSCVLGMLCRKL